MNDGNLYLAFYTLVFTPFQATLEHIRQLKSNSIIFTSFWLFTAPIRILNSAAATISIHDFMLNRI
jgi:hypothetical protein